MDAKEKKRKCFKCGSSPAEDNVKLFRFLKPGKRNLRRCTLWTQYIFPDKEYTSIDLQKKIYSEHRMLCQRHFKDDDFTDSSKKQLLKTAVPCDVQHQLSAYNVEPQAGTSQMVLQDVSNLQNVQPSSSAASQSQAKQSQKHQLSTNNVEPQAGTSQMVLQDVSNLQNVQPSSSAASQSQAKQSQKHQLSTNNVEPQAGTSQMVLQDVSNLQNVQPSTSAASQSQAKLSQAKQSQKTEKDKILYGKCRKYMQKICQLRNRIKSLKSKQILERITEDSSVKKLSQKVSPTFACLLQGQIRNFKKKCTGRRWKKEEKITALRIYKRSPTCYRLLRRLFQLPSPSTLKTLLNKVPFGVGINEPVFKVLKTYSETQKASDNEYTLMFDEMSIKKHLAYNLKDDIIEGYQDHASQGRSSLIAAYALVFMIAGIRKRVKQPIAHFFSSGFSTADRLAVLIKQVLSKCLEAGLNIAAIVCDMDGVNRRALTILGASMEHPFITVHNKEIVTLFDPPHLLKCFRNLFMKYDIECTTNISSSDRTGRGIAKWSHIKEFYEVDNRNPNFVYAPVLKKEHLNPNSKQKMRVKLAAQVLSHSVAGGMLAKIANGELPAEASVTASMITSMDNLFDSLNSDCADLRRGKPYATNLKSSSPHLKLFKEMKTFFCTMKYVGSPRKPPSQEGWVWSLTAIEKLWKNLVQKHNIKSMATRRIQQDPLENLFGCIRGNCGTNINPTCSQFVAGLKTAVLSNLSRFGTTGNCETDNNVIIHNFETLLSVTQPSQSRTQPEIFAQTELSLKESINEYDAEIQACAYVCGFLVKQLPTDCQYCKKIFISTQVENHHLFVEFREYSDHQKSLNYVTKDLVACVEYCATLMNDLLKEQGHTTNIKKNITENAKSIINFDFLNGCTEHKEKNIDTITNSIFMICVKRFCILKNRLFAEEVSAAALKRKMNIILHK